MKVPGLRASELKWYCCYCSATKRPSDLLSLISESCSAGPDHVDVSVDATDMVHIGTEDRGKQCVFLWR